VLTIQISFQRNIYGNRVYNECVHIYDSDIIKVRMPTDKGKETSD